jgi:hypothetical protein
MRACERASTASSTAEPHVNQSGIFFVENLGYGTFFKRPSVVSYIHSGQTNCAEVFVYGAAPCAGNASSSSGSDVCTWAEAPDRIV